MSYSPKFVTFFREYHNLSPSACIALMEQLGSRPVGSYISATDIRLSIGGNISQSVAVLQQLAAIGICRSRPVDCPHCEQPIDLTGHRVSEEIECPVCCEIIQPWCEPTHMVVEGLSQSAYQEALWARGYELDAQSLSQAWSENKSIAYMSADVVSSEAVQNNAPLEFPDFLRLINRNIWPAALSPASGDFIFLGEVGDAVDIALKTADQAYLSTMRFLHYLRTNYLGVNQQSWYNDGYSNTPRFSVTIGTVPLPVGENGKYERPERLLVQTLDRKWDIHAPAVTSLYRLASYASPKSEAIRSEPWLLSVLINADTLHTLNSRGLAREFPEERVPVTISKHQGATVEDRVAVVLYFKNGHRALRRDEFPH